MPEVLWYFATITPYLEEIVPILPVLRPHFHNYCQTSSRIEPKSDKEAIILYFIILYVPNSNSNPYIVKPSSLGKNSLLLVRLFTNPALVTTYVLNSKISSKSCNRSLLLLPSFKIILSMIWRKKIFTMVHKKLSLKVQCTFFAEIFFHPIQ